MISVIIIDDEALARNAMKNMVTKLCPDINIVGEADGISSGIKAIKTLKPDAIFLDIMMNDGTGFDLLDQFSAPEFGIIFTTGHDQFTLAAFENNALHYLLKPIHPDKLVEACERLKRKVKQDKLALRLKGLKEDVQKQQHQNLTLKNNNEINFLRLDDIIRLEAFDNITFFHPINRERITETKSLKQFEKILPTKQFFRIHQSHIINKSFVDKVDKADGWQVLMRNGNWVPIARRKQQEFLKWMKR